jgi:glycosyltransferase involved in cell wall biosynthesis
MFCSAIIPTINRSTLSRAVYSVLNQEFKADEFEVIVVNDTGQPLPEAEWQGLKNVQVITTQRRERSAARNAGAAIARGKYLYFLDDDDIMLPGALQVFWKLSKLSDAAWLYGGYQLVDNDGRVIEEFRPEINGNIFAYLVAGEGIPLQVSLLRADAFYDAGEFDVYFTGAQDRDLGRRIALRYQVESTSELVAQIRVGQIKSSTVWSTLPEFDRLGREKAFEQPNSFEALWDSARKNGNLHGRVSRAYLASAIWNLKHKYIFRAGSRLASMVAFGLPFILLSGFWQGVRTHIQPLGTIRQESDPPDTILIPLAIILTMFVLIGLLWLRRRP